MSQLAMTGMHSGPIHRSWLDVRRVPMTFEQPPPSWIDRRIAQISDLHVSPFVWQGFMREQLRHVADLKPDLLVVTGDLITGGHRYASMAAKLLGEIDPPPLGTLAILGNHDYGLRGKRNPIEGERIARRIEAELRLVDVRLLRNESVVIDGLSFVGLDDLYTCRLDPVAAFDGVTGPTVCLNHDPRNASSLLEYPWRWMLAGHTHGRQLATSRLGQTFNKKRRRPFVRGRYDLADGKVLYVNRGLSYGQRWQSWCKPEITVFKVKPTVGGPTT
jgi:predicted MPP superfamily phosphohydrolase